MNLLIALVAGCLIGGAGALLATADIRLRRRPTVGERLARLSGAARDRVVDAAANAVTGLTGAIPAAAERFRD